MPQGPLRQILMPPPVQSGPPVQLDQTPLAQTNPGLARLVDFFGGLTGLTDPLMDPNASNAAVAGVGVGALLPLGAAVGGLKKVKNLIAPAKTSAGPLRQIAQPIKAYHGSPHDFDKFSLSKIGTGEGAQAYGHGLYFAENPGVAKGYRDQLATGKVELYGQEHSVPPWRGDMDPHTRLVRRLADARAGKTTATDAEIVASVRKKLQDELQNQYGDKASLTKELEFLDRAEQHPAGIKTDPGGRMYEVGLHASPDEFLDWDKPLSQQSEKVRKALEGVGVPNVKDATAPGSQMYQFMSQGAWDKSIDDKVKAAEKLKAAGIKGIRYLDQGSRSAADVNDLRSTAAMWKRALDKTPNDAYAKDMATKAANELAAAEKALTSNFVVFDDDIIEIQKKLALLLAAGAGTAAATREKPKHQ